MPFVVYFFVLLITAGSVAFGLDWAQAPMSPMPASTYELRAAKPPEQPKPAVAELKPESNPKPVTESAPKPVAAVTPPVALEPALPPIMAPEPVAAAQATPKCDVAACGAAYFTFTASDCTYQPSDGPRRLCTKGNPPKEQTVSQAPRDANAQAACNIAACSQAYVSFSAADCTYQPIDGPRRLCAK
jgi:BA14K-like protein